MAMAMAMAMEMASRPTATLIMIIIIITLKDRVVTVRMWYPKQSPEYRGGKWPRMFSDDNRIWTYRDYLKVHNTYMYEKDIRQKEPTFQFQLRDSPSLIPGVGGKMNTQDFLPDLSKTLGAFTNSLMQSFPAGDLVLKHSNSTSMKYSEDWVSGTIPPDLTYRQAKLGRE